MKKIITDSYKDVLKNTFSQSDLEYKGHKIIVEDDYEDDNIKTYYTVITPSGKTLYPDVTPYPYKGGVKAVELWIDAGYPARVGSGPWDVESLQKVLSKKYHRGILPPKDSETTWLTNQEPPLEGDSDLTNKFSSVVTAKKSPAWQRSEGKNREGGLNEKGRKSYEREHPGSNLKAPVTESNPTGKRKKRKDSFCARMKGMKSKLTSEETKRDPDSRINKSLRKWKC